MHIPSSSGNGRLNPRVDIAHNRTLVVDLGRAIARDKLCDAVQDLRSLARHRLFCGLAGPVYRRKALQQTVLLKFSLLPAIRGACTRLGLLLFLGGHLLRRPSFDRRTFLARKIPSLLVHLRQATRAPRT